MKNIVMASVLATTFISGGVVTHEELNKEVTLIVKGEELNVGTFSKSVEEVLNERNIKYDNNDIISLPLDTELEDGQKIEVIDVEVKMSKEVEELDFETTTIEDENLLKGKTVVSKEGQNGEKELRYNETYHNGKLIETKFIEEVVVKAPVDKVIKEGTKVEPPKVEEPKVEIKEEVVVAMKSRMIEEAPVKEKVSENKKEEVKEEPKKEEVKPEVKPEPEVEKPKEEVVDSKGTQMVVNASAYTATGNPTASGVMPTWGTIAVDPNVIPMGTKVYIPQFDKVFVAQDKGGAIKGNKIDIFMNSKSEAINWGRRNIDIYVLD